MKEETDQATGLTTSMEISIHHPLAGRRVNTGIKSKIFNSKPIHQMQDKEVDILLVEDSELDAEITIRALRRNNISNHIVHISDPVEAIDFLFGQGGYQDRDISKKPRLIMLDLKMPKVDGTEVLSRLKANPVTRLIPVVVLTSSREHPDVNKCYELGANSYIVKPVGFNNFMEAIANSGMYWILINQPAS